ncbi:MAG: PEGA domain-containing protein [Proteobacteria bacterium]|nr:PEGA domain-containing protein [Pseudomonadota bacterium]
MRARVCPTVTVLAAFLAICGLGVGQALADNGPKTIAIAWLDVEGDASSRFKTDVQEKIVDRLESVGVKCIRYKQVVRATRRGPERVGCTNASCLQKLAKRVGAQHFLRVGVESSGAAYELELALYSAKDGGKQQIRESCEVCTVDKALDLIGQTATRVLQAKREVPAVAVELLTQPGDAALQIDERSVGQAPYRGKLVPKAYIITASRPDFLDTKRRITVRAGTDQTQRFTIPLDLPPPPDRRFATLKWVGVGAGTAALVAGIGWLITDGSGTCSDPTCPDVYDTQTPGLISVGVGVIASAFTGYMFFKDRNDARKAREYNALKRARAILAPARGGAVGAVRVEF